MKSITKKEKKKKTEEVRGQTMPLTPPRSKGLLPSLSITITATPVITNYNSKVPRLSHSKGNISLHKNLFTRIRQFKIC